MPSMPSRSIGVSGGTAPKKGMARSVGEGRVSLIVSVSPRAMTPAMLRVRPARYARSPTRSGGSAAAYEPVRGESARSIARLKAAAVTGLPEGGEKRNPCRRRYE
jgi:hypothetical protein